MALKDMLLPEFDREAGATRRLLERVPFEHCDWRPHARSMSLGELVGHLVDVAGWGAATLTTDTIDLPEGEAAPCARSREAALHLFDDHVAKTRLAILERADAELVAAWTLRRAGQDVFTAPKIMVLRTFVLNHLIHHRGQLSVYLRLHDIPLPSLYGTSADEQTF